MFVCYCCCCCFSQSGAPLFHQLQPISHKALLDPISPHKKKRKKKKRNSDAFTADISKSPPQSPTLLHGSLDPVSVLPPLNNALPSAPMRSHMTAPPPPSGTKPLMNALMLEQLKARLDKANENLPLHSLSSSSLPSLGPSPYHTPTPSPHRHTIDEHSAPSPESRQTPQKFKFSSPVKQDGGAEMESDLAKVQSPSYRREDGEPVSSDVHAHRRSSSKRQKSPSTPLANVQTSHISHRSSKTHVDDEAGVSKTPDDLHSPPATREKKGSKHSRMTESQIVRSSKPKPESGREFPGNQ